jgi:hypothetical protein
LEREMMNRLQEAHDDFFAAPAENKKAALQQYLNTLSEFSALLATGDDGVAYGG